MAFLSKLLGRNKPSVVAADQKLSPTDQAIVMAKSGQLPVQEMLKRLVSGALFIPLAEPMSDPSPLGFKWKPATVTKSADGTQWLIAFTDSALASKFSKDNRGFTYGFCVDTEWVLNAIPPAHGLLVNAESDKMFEWNAEGLSRYKRDVLAKSTS
jgi:SseB protein N-terminal domain